MRRGCKLSLRPLRKLTSLGTIRVVAPQASIERRSASAEDRAFLFRQVSEKSRFLGTQNNSTDWERHWDVLVRLCVEQATVLPTLEGWAPEPAARLLSEARLDWQLSLAETIKMWLGRELSSGELILAWTNLGSLLEGTLAVFLTVYYNNYERDRPTSKDAPQKLILKDMQAYFRKQDISDAAQDDLIDLIRKRRNAVHSLRNREIGNAEEFTKCFVHYCMFASDLRNRWPNMPSDHGF